MYEKKRKVFKGTLVAPDPGGSRGILAVDNGWQVSLFPHVLPAKSLKRRAKCFVSSRRSR